MESLQKFSKLWKVLGLLLISHSFLNTFDLTDVEIYNKIWPLSNQSQTKTRSGNTLDDNWGHDGA